MQEIVEIVTKLMKSQLYKYDFIMVYSLTPRNRLGKKNPDFLDRDF
tara:strand:+ start:104816 stop:104953 length:138 start_codon:yes stop_codon:yes gene_type:complete